MTQPTGVFVRLPLCEERAITFHKESSHAWDEFNGSSNALACEAGLLAIGTPVTGEELEAVCSIDEDILRDISELDYDDEEFVTDMVFKPNPEDVDTVNLVRQSDALAKLAEKDAEIARLQEALKKCLEIATSRADGTTCAGFVKKAFSLSRTAGMTVDDVVQITLGDMFPILKGQET